MWYELIRGGILSLTTFSVLFTLPFYCLVLIVVRNNRNVEPFNSNFYTIFFAMGLSDITCYFFQLWKKAFFFGFVPDIFLPYNKPNLFVSIFYYPFWISAFVHYQMSFLLTLNRFVAIVFPMVYIRWWNPKRNQKIIHKCLFISLIYALPIPFMSAQIKEYTTQLDSVNRTMHFGPVISDPWISKYLNFLWGCHIYGLICVSILLYAIMIFKLRRQTLVGSTRRFEMQMFNAGLLVFALNLFFVVYFYLRDHVLTTQNTHIHEWFFLFISDFYDLSNGIALWMTSTKLRQIIVTDVQSLFKRNNTVIVLRSASNQAEQRHPTSITEPQKSMVANGSVKSY